MDDQKEVVQDEVSRLTNESDAAKEIQVSSQLPSTRSTPQHKKTRSKKQPVAFEKLAGVPAKQEEQPTRAMARSKSIKVSKRLSGAFHEIWQRQEDRVDEEEAAEEEQKIPPSGRLTPSKTRFADDPNANEASEPPAKGTGLGRAMSIRLPLRSKSTRKPASQVENKESQSTTAPTPKPAEVVTVDAPLASKPKGLGRALSLRSFSRPRPVGDTAHPSNQTASRYRPAERANIAAIIEEPVTSIGPDQEEKGHEKASPLKFRRQGAKARSGLSIRATPAQHMEALAKQEKTAAAQEKPSTSKWRFWKA